MHCIPIKIECDKDFFWQWDLNKRLVLGTDRTDIQVHFDAGSNEALAVDVYKENGKVYANIPNILLQEYGRIKCWVYDPGNEATTLQVFYFTVAERDRPPDYVYTETETLTWHELEKRIAELEENGVGGGGEFLVTVEWDPATSSASSETTAEEIRAAYAKGLTPVCQVYLDDYQGYFRMPMITADGLGNGVVAFSGILFYMQIIFGFFDGGVSVEIFPLAQEKPETSNYPLTLVNAEFDTGDVGEAYYDGTEAVSVKLPRSAVVTIAGNDGEYLILNNHFYRDDIEHALKTSSAYCRMWMGSNYVLVPFVYQYSTDKGYEYVFKGQYPDSSGAKQEATVTLKFVETQELLKDYIVSVVPVPDSPGEGGADIEEIVQAVIDALPVYDGEVVEV